MFHRIIVSPAINARGRRLHGQFEARLKERTVRLICTSREPLLDAARLLLAEGADAADTIVMRHAGTVFDAMSGQIGALARLTVEEGEKIGPRFRCWKAFSRCDVQAPMRFDARPVPDSERGLERIHDGAAP